MITFAGSTPIFVSSRPLDMRKGYDTLAALVSTEFKKDVFSGALFVFFNRSADRVKLFYWERNGYCLWQKRLEKGRFRLPKVNKVCYALSASDLNCLLEGIDLLDKQRLKAV